MAFELFEFVFMLGGEIFVTFAGIVGFTFVSELVIYPVLVFVPRMFALLAVVLFATVLHPPRAAAPASKSVDKNFIVPPVFLKDK